MRNITANLLFSERFSFYLFVFQSRLENVAAAAYTLARTWSFPWRLCHFRTHRLHLLQEFWTWLSSCRQMYDESGLGEKTLMTSADTCSSATLCADFCSMDGYTGVPEPDQPLSPKEQRGTVPSVSFGEDKVDVQINWYWNLAASQVWSFIRS